MSLAPVAYLLFQKVMRHNPADTHWPGRDRFVLSCGHSSLTLYIQLYLGGFGLELDDLKALRTWDSKTPGHPEYGHTDGVEITTGPLGQGIANAVGMAMAARRERGLLDPDAAPGESPFDHHIYCLASDGDIEEGVSSRGVLAGRHPAAGQPDADLRQQPDLHRGRHQHRPLRGRRGPLRRVRLARPDGRLDQRRHQLRRGRRGPARRASRRREAVTDQPSFIQLRTIIAWPAPKLQGTGKAARLRARRRRGRGDQEGAGLRPGADLRGRRRGHRPHPRAARPRPAGAGRVAAGLRRLGRGQPRGQGALRPVRRRRAEPRLGRRPARAGRPTPRASPPGPPPAR